MDAGNDTRDESLGVNPTWIAAYALGVSMSNRATREALDELAWMAARRPELVYDALEHVRGLGQPNAAMRESATRLLLQALARLVKCEQSGSGGRHAHRSA